MHSFFRMLSGPKTDLHRLIWFYLVPKTDKESTVKFLMFSQIKVHFKHVSLNQFCSFSTSFGST